MLMDCAQKTTTLLTSTSTLITVYRVTAIISAVQLDYNVLTDGVMMAPDAQMMEKPPLSDANLAIIELLYAPAKNVSCYYITIYDEMLEV